MTAVRVLQVLGGSGRGGIETWLLRVLPRLRDAGFHIDILVHGQDDRGYQRDFQQLGAAILDCGDHRRPWSYIPRFMRLLRTHGPYDIVHGQMYLLSGLHLHLARLAGVPHRVAHIHPVTDVVTGTGLRPLYRRLMSALIAANATCLMFPSHSSQTAWSRAGSVSHLPQVLVPNCIAAQPPRTDVSRDRTRQALGLPIDRPLVVVVGRFVAHKNHVLAFAIADALDRRGIPVHIALVGSHGDRLADLQARASGRSGFSILVGLPDVGPLMTSADAVLIPSLEEGFGVVAIEAQAAGVPVVATDLPALREAVTAGMHRLLFAPQDADGAATQLASLITDSVLRQRLTEEGRDFAARFSVTASADALMTGYHLHCEPRVIARRPPKMA